MACGLSVTVLDHDAELIEQTRRFGFRVFYGDATRLDLLRTAGAAQARVLVVAVDDSAQSLAIVDLARAHFPALKIVARARDVTHWYALRDRGVEHIQRELFESSLASAGDVLQLLGRDAATATQATQRFRSHNLALLEETYPLHKDEARLIAAVRQGRQQLQEQLARERESRGPDRAGAEPAARPSVPKF